MHNATVPLQLHDIVRSPAISGSNDVGVWITRSLITEAVQRLH
jgi:hypothetical protein